MAAQYVKARVWRYALLLLVAYGIYNGDNDEVPTPSRPEDLNFLLGPESKICVHHKILI